MEENGRLAQMYAAIPKTIKAAFFACFFVGFLVHLYAFTNIIPNSDGLSRVFDQQQMTISGRWFLHCASMLHGYIQAPALIGALSLLFLSLAAALTVDMLRVHSVWAALLCGCFLSTAPAVAYTYLYMFTASAYAFGILLAVLAVWLARKHPWGFLFGAIPLACAIGTYQAYASVAAALVLVCVVLDLLDGSFTGKDAGKMLAFLALGAALYGVILQGFLTIKDLELLDYRGINGPVASFSGLVQVYVEFFQYFLVPGGVSYISVPLTIVQLLLFLCGGIALMKQWSRQWLLIPMLALIPLACNFFRIFTDSAPIMRYAFVFPLILAVVLIDRAGIPRLRTAAGALGIVVVLVCAQMANTAYTASATAHRATEAFATNLVGRVESTPGYENGMEVVIIGGFPDDVYYSNVETFRTVEHYSCLSSSVMPLNKHVYYYLNDWLNVPWQEPEEELLIAISESEAFQAMALYPSDGSVAILDGRVVVRLAETYTPKQDYEIAYENRK